MKPVGVGITPAVDDAYISFIEQGFFRFHYRIKPELFPGFQQLVFFQSKCWPGPIIDIISVGDDGIQPIVATGLSCDGINIDAGKDILIADEPDSCADAVNKLLEDKELAEKLAQNGRAKVEKHYDWESKANKLEKIFQRAVK